MIIDTLRDALRKRPEVPFPREKALSVISDYFESSPSPTQGLFLLRKEEIKQNGKRKGANLFIFSFSNHTNHQSQIVFQNKSKQKRIQPSQKINQKN